MLLVVDVGNTNTVFGIYKKGKRIKDWRIRTDSRVTEDEFNVLAEGLLSSGKIKLKEIDKTIISSVVPEVMAAWDTFCKKYLGHSPIWVNADTVSNIMPVLYDNPLEVGADRIVNSVAAFDKYKSSLIVIDFGTATTFDVVSEKGEYLGGAISPGLAISSEALFKNASKLPRVDFQSPLLNAIGKNTIDSMKSGILFGYVGLVDGMVMRIKKEMDSGPKIIATGGLSSIVSRVSETIDHIEPSLTLDGLLIISENL